MKWNALFAGIALVAISAWMTGCADKATRQLRRAERLIKKAEQNGAVWKTDTVFLDKEVITEKLVTDTLTEFTTDTIRITKDRIVTVVKVSPKTIYVRSECLPDTIRIKVPVTVTKILHAPESKYSMKWWWLIIVACIFTLFGIWVNRK